MQVITKKLGNLTVEMKIGIPVWTWLHLGLGICPVKAVVEVFEGTGEDRKPKKVQQIEVVAKTWKYIFRSKREGYQPSIDTLMTESTTGEAKFTYTVANITMPRPLWAGGDPKGIGFKATVRESPGNYVELSGHWGDPTPLPKDFKDEEVK